MIALLGIDCATVPNKTGLALGELRGGVVHILRCAIGSKSATPAVIAAEWLRDYDEVLIALDAPLGWPRALGACLSGHTAGMVLGAESNQLFRRAADVEIKQRLGKLPLEVGANFIARTAVAALVLLDCIRKDSGRSIPLAWAPAESAPWRAIEAYPAATRIGHGAPDAGGSLEGLGDVLDCSAVPSTLLQIDHVGDAAVCSLAAADFLLGRAVGPVDHELALVEGWIWAPGAPQGPGKRDRQYPNRQDDHVRQSTRSLDRSMAPPGETSPVAPGRCLACGRGLPVESPRQCPVCDKVFAGEGWGGIDAHWKGKHNDVMAYEDFWSSLCANHRGR
jgi:hypothetical protein